MKNVFQILVLFFIPGMLAAQNHSVIFPFSHNFLYKGISTEVIVGLPGIAADSVELTSSDGLIAKIDNWRWDVTPDTTSIKMAVTVRAWNHGVKVHEDFMEFRVMWIPSPVIFVDNASESNVLRTKQKLSSASGVFARVENFDRDVWCKVSSFQLVVQTTSGTQSFTGSSGAFTPEMRAAIQKLSPGDKVSFEQVIVNYPDARVRTLNGPSFIIQ